MSNFLPPVTVDKTLALIQQRSYLLPAIQREFVWNAEQVCTLFDSLLRGYPIGTFLLWAVDAEQAQEFRFYEFITDYHELNHPYAPVAHIPHGSGVTAVLDGQQRLTALNIGVYGSLAERLPRKWANNPDAYPKKRLHLDLLHQGDDENLSVRHRFRFLTESDATGLDDGPRRWFRVGDVLKFDDSGPAMLDWLTNHGFQNKLNVAYKQLHALHKAVKEREALTAYQEDDQDPNTVLDIFVRVNSGGTTLSYSDLLLSMATNQWSGIDARQEVRNLVDELNGTGQVMSFTRDNILKTALVLIDLPDIRFNVSNFTSSNMAELEKQWDGVRAAMLLSARLLMSFGLTARTLTANSVIIPIAYYLYKRQATDSYITAPSHAGDRNIIRTWVFRSLVKRGIWGSGLDTLLVRLREALRSAPQSWPVEALENAMAPLGKSLTFSAAEIRELTELQYNSPRTFPVLALLYPGLDLSEQFHEDHIYPKAKFTPAQLRRAGVPEATRDEFRAAVNGLPNLQLLRGAVNVAKKDLWPWEWLQSPYFVSDAQRLQYRADNDLDLLPNTIDDFLEFYEGRRARLETRLRALLEVEDEDQPEIHAVASRSNEVFRTPDDRNGRGFTLDPGEPVAVYAVYGGVRTTGEFDVTSRRLTITSGPLQGSSYTSPTGAARAIVAFHNPAVASNRNGWVFWMIDDENSSPLQVLR